MPVHGIALGAAGRLAVGVLGRLTKKGTGKILTQPGTSIIRRVPPGGLQIPGSPGIGGAITRAGRKGLGKRAVGLIGAGVAFEAGGRIFSVLTGQEIKTTRRMNPGNTKALKRSVRRLNSAAKMYGRVLSATKGKRTSGYLIKPRKSGRKCA